MRLSLLLATTLMLASITAFAATRETGFLNRTVTVDGTTYKYAVYVPANFSPEKKWPIVLFLHGAGERGEEGSLQTDTGIGTALRRYPDRYPAIVVMPQCRPNQNWNLPAMQAQALAALEQSSTEFNGDPDRTYLTGLSLGGYGTWGLAQAKPGKFAAIAPVCGGVVPPPGARGILPQNSEEDPYNAAAKRVGKVPAWIFHGEADSVVPATESQKMYAAMKALGGDVHYSEYHAVNHNSWDKAYADPDLPRWMFSQKLK
jgi:predicted peptidase